MMTPTKADSLATTVEAVDGLSKAIEAAIARAEKIYSKGSKTLIDELGVDALKACEGDEKFLIADPDGLGAEDEAYLCEAA
jgi:hypothetical protein